jgi:uncharacterized membrane protein
VLKVWSLLSLLITLTGVGLVIGAILLRPGPEGSWQGSALTRDLLFLAGAVFAGSGGLLGGLIRRRIRRDADLFLSRSEEQTLIEAITAAEQRTSGEIRVHLESRSPADVLAAARATFEELGMTATQQRNGVLFFISVKDRTIALVGDAGIHAVVEESFWNETVRSIESHFREGKRLEGLLAGIHAVAERLARHFPPVPRDVDELPNTLSRD